MQWLLMRPWTQGIPWFHCLQAGGGEPRRVSFGGIATTATKDAIRLYLGFGDHTMALRWGGVWRVSAFWPLPRGTPDPRGWWRDEPNLHPMAAPPTPRSTTPAPAATPPALPPLQKRRAVGSPTARSIGGHPTHPATWTDFASIPRGIPGRSSEGVDPIHPHVDAKKVWATCRHPRRTCADRALFLAFTGGRKGGGGVPDPTPIPLQPWFGWFGIRSSGERIPTGGRESASFDV